MEPSRPWMISCDTGVDDALALGVAVAHPAFELVAVVASAGNAPLAAVVANTAGVLGLLGWQGRLGVGDEHPLSGTAHGYAGHVHGHDGLLGHRGALPAGPEPDDQGLALVQGAVLATGPLTTAARALAAGTAIERVVWMGGGLAHGNVTPFAEFNAWWDPAAVDAVVGAAVPVRVVPLDLTEPVRMDTTGIATLAAAGAAGRFFAALEADCQAGTPRAALHDPVAVLAAVEPERFEWQRVRLRCDRAGETAGRTVVTPDPDSPVEVAVAADADGLRARIVELLASLP